jgi:RNA polymerase sigma-70 factor (ECF subfamily)
VTKNIEKSSDAQLVARLHEGDEHAFDEVYDAYRPRIFSFLARLTGQPALAEDLLQETFLRFAKNAAVLRSDTRLSSWLFTVARNLHLSHRRWAVLDLGRLAELRMWAQLQPPAPTPFALAATSETQGNLETAIAALPLRMREVVLLVAMEQMTPSEAAEIIGDKPEAVRKRLSRARDMLRLHLSRQ